MQQVFIKALRIILARIISGERLRLMSRDRGRMAISGFCNDRFHDNCKHKFDFGAEYLNRYFTCECECHTEKAATPKARKKVKSGS